MGGVVIIIGVLFLGYSFLFKGYVNIYNRGNGFVLLNKEAFLKLQLRMSLLSSWLIILLGIATLVLNVPGHYCVLYTLAVHVGNSLTKHIGVKKKFIEYA